MPYTLPSVEDFKTRFPNLANKGDPYIASMILEASAHIDETWEESDYQPAILYLAAHLIAMDNSQTGSTPDTGGVRGPITSESFSGMSRSYGSSGQQSGNGAANSRYGATEYGRRYWDLLQANKPGIVAV